MVSYNDLYEALRKERYSEDLQKLPAKFLSQVSSYFEEKKEVSEKESDVFSDISVKNKKKLENAIAIFRELLLRRRKKILTLAFVASETGISKRDFENLLGFEKELFEEIVKSLERAEKNLQEGMTNTSGNTEEEKYVLVRFLQDVEQFLGLEGEDVGPFKKGEIANLEKEIIEILKKDERVEVIDDG